LVAVSNYRSLTSKPFDLDVFELFNHLSVDIQGNITFLIVD